MSTPREVLRVSTADNVAVGWDVAGLGSRCAAQIVDWLIVGVIDTIAAAVVLAAAMGGDPQASTVALLATAGVVIAVTIGYFLVCEIATGGRTPGKSVMSLRVISLQGTTPTVAQLVVRNIARLVDLLLGVGVVVMFVSRSSRRVGDLLAGTLVVHTRAAVSFATAVAPPPVMLRSPDSGPEVDNLGRLGDHELSALRTFLSRRGLDPAVRGRLAADIAQRMLVRLDLPPTAPERQWPPELFLERLYLQLQERAR